MNTLPGWNEYTTWREWNLSYKCVIHGMNTISGGNEFYPIKCILFSTFKHINEGGEIHGQNRVFHTQSFLPCHRKFISYGVDFQQILLNLNSPVWKKWFSVNYLVKIHSTSYQSRPFSCSSGSTSTFQSLSSYVYIVNPLATINR